MQPESPDQPRVLAYARATRRARWRTPTALAFAVPGGFWAGWWTHTSMAGWVAIVLFAVVGPLCLGLLTRRYHVVIGLVFCLAMSGALLRGSMQFYAQIGDPFTPLQSINWFAICFMVTGFISLLATAPLTAAKRPTA